MDTTSKKYKIDKHKQLIPLNGTVVNFSCFFEVTCKDKKPFNVTIVEQNDLKPKQYKLVDNGYINGQIESDGQLKSYFLVLKAQQEPCECDVKVVVKPKENNTQPQPPLSAQPETTAEERGGIEHGQRLEFVPSQPMSYFQPKYIIGISGVLVVLYLLYRYRQTIFKFEKKVETSLSPSFY